MDRRHARGGARGLLAALRPRRADRADLDPRRRRRALGFVRYQDKAHRYVVTRGELLDDLCVLMGGREAEALLLDDLSIGAVDDLRRATAIARAIVEEFGLGGDEVGVGRFASDEKGRPLSPARLELLDRRVSEILEDARRRAAAILAENRAAVEALRELLVEKKVIDARTLASLAAPEGGMTDGGRPGAEHPPRTLEGRPPCPR